MALLSSRRENLELAPALPINSEVFAKNRIVLRRGQFSIVAAAPSIGKSVLARNVAAATKCPALFFSADSDEYTVKVSVAAKLSGQKIETVEAQMLDESYSAWYDQLLSKVDHVDFCYSTDISPSFITKRMKAYAEVYGDWPHLIFVDNLGDMAADEGGDEYAELRENCRELRRLARMSKAHIMGLHHAKGAWENGDKPITLGALLGNVGKVPEVVLGLHVEQGTVYMTAPKLRGAKRGLSVPLQMDYSTASIAGFHVA